MLEVDEVVTEQGSTAPSDGTWVLQGDAAARTGFSVSAIRKWRRMGVVADRKMMGPGGFERVEVKLEDVLARAALQPDRQQPDPSANGGPGRAGSVVMALEDLESLFERMVLAERRAEKAEAEVESLEGRARFMSGQLAELRRQLEAAGAQSADARAVKVAAPAVAGPAAANAAPVVPPTPPTARVRPAPPVPPAPPGPQGAGGAAAGGAPTIPVAVPGSNGHRLPVDDVPPAPAPAAIRPAVEDPGARLRPIYSRLDQYRRQAVITPDAELERQRLLAEYDRELIAACSALRIPTGLGEGDTVTVSVRAGLTRALAQAGVDVRADVRESTDQRVRRPRPGWRS